MPELNLGKVVGPQGPQGAAGPAGAQGIQGIQGVSGKDATINGYNALNLTAGGTAQLTQDDQGNAVITASGENLLDNAYWANIDSIIDQRKGYVVLPDTPYYSDDGLTTQAGTVSEYTKATYMSETVCSLNIDGVEYYVGVGLYIPSGVPGYSDPELKNVVNSSLQYIHPVVSITDKYATYLIDGKTTRYVHRDVVRQGAVRGYVGTSYTIDRWKVHGSGYKTLVFFTDDGLELRKGGTANSGLFYQDLEDSNKEDLMYTFSALVEGVTKGAQLTMTIRSVEMNSETIYAIVSRTTDTGLVSCSGRVPAGKRIRAQLTAGDPDNTGGSIFIKAVKLELGSTQTLARNIGTEDSPNWVLNDPPPNKALEMTKCQRYYQLFSSAEKRPTDKRDFRPELRTDATSSNTGTIVIDGTTYYYADANLS